VTDKPVLWHNPEDIYDITTIYDPEYHQGWTPLYAAPVDMPQGEPTSVDAKAIREERDSMWLAQMEFEEKRVRAEALEEAAKVCEEEAKGFEQAHLWDEEYAVKNCAAAIRARGEK
jgi:hypothetical protein